mgnify:CR=1 FL=1
MPFIVAIVAIIGGLLYSAYEQKVKLQIAKEKNRTSTADENVAKELAQLKERVAVLEKIVTDKNYSLKEEIDSLNRAS